MCAFIFFKHHWRNCKLKPLMKRHVEIVAMCAKNIDVEIARFLEATKLFVHKIRKELEASSRDVSPVAFGGYHDSAIRTACSYHYQ